MPARSSWNQKEDQLVHDEVHVLRLVEDLV